MLQTMRLGLILSVILVPLSMGASGEMTHSPVLIKMENWAPYYRPYEATIPPQTPIYWKNPTASPHTVRHDGCVNGGTCLFDSGTVVPNETYTIQGLEPGRYSYHCELHPIMGGS